MVSEGAVAILEGEALLLLLTEILPVDVYGRGIRRKESSHAIGNNRASEFVVLTQSILYYDALAVASISCECDSIGCYVRRSKGEILGRDILFLGNEGEVELLGSLVEKGDILITVVILKALDDCLLHCGTSG